MSNDWFSDVVKFQRKMGRMNPETQGSTQQLIRFRRALMAEEWQETKAALYAFEHYSKSRHTTKSVELTSAYLKNMASELVDLVYTVLGTFAEFDIDPQPVWDAIHAANMQKERNPGGGKAVKPDGWKKPEFPLYAVGTRPTVESNQSLAATRSRIARPARRLVQAIGQPLERSVARRIQVGRISDLSPEQRSNNCFLCGLPRTLGGGCEGNC